MSQLKGLLLDRPDRLCLSCHVDLQKQMASGIVHPPAKEGECLGCHKPHSSTFASLLTENIPQQCLACHDGEDQTFKEKHLNLSGSRIDCRKCHNPHVSVTAGLIQSQVHAPFKDGMCDACHEPVPQEKKP
jgi:predicted CXXCH cytochrome family protein